MQLSQQVLGPIFDKWLRFLNRALQRFITRKKCKITLLSHKCRYPPQLWKVISNHFFYVVGGSRRRNSKCCNWRHWEQKNQIREASKCHPDLCYVAYIIHFSYEQKQALRLAVPSRFNKWWHDHKALVCIARVLTSEPAKHQGGATTMPALVARPRHRKNGSGFSALGCSVSKQCCTCLQGSFATKPAAASVPHCTGFRCPSRSYYHRLCTVWLQLVLGPAPTLSPVARQAGKMLCWPVKLAVSPATEEGGGCACQPCLSPQTEVPSAGKR